VNLGVDRGPTRYDCDERGRDMDASWRPTFAERERPRRLPRRLGRLPEDRVVRLGQCGRASDEHARSVRAARVSAARPVGYRADRSVSLAVTFLPDPGVSVIVVAREDRIRSVDPNGVGKFSVMVEHRSLLVG
jgi:hypothetical protein